MERKERQRPLFEQAQAAKEAREAAGGDSGGDPLPFNPSATATFAKSERDLRVDAARDAEAKRRLPKLSTLALVAAGVIAVVIVRSG